MPDIPFITDVSPIPQYHQVTAVLALGTVPPIRVTDLHFDWQVSKTMSAEPDICTVNIYNMGPSQREAILFKFSESLALSTPSPIAAAIAGIGGAEADPFVPLVEGVSLFVGWQGRSQLLFTGGMISVQPEIYQPPNVVTQITASDAGLDMRESPPPGGEGFGLAAGTLLAIHAGALNLKLSEVALAKVVQRGAELPIKQWQFSSGTDSRIILNDLFASMGLKWGVTNKTLVCYDGGIRDDLLPIRLDTGSGLLNWTRVDDGAYTLQALARVDVLPGGRILAFDQNKFAIGLGPLRVHSVNFNGDNDGQSLMAIEARKLDLIGDVGPFGVFV